MKEIIDIVHKSILPFFDVCEDGEEPQSDKDKLLLKVNKAICNNLKALEQEPCDDAISRDAVLKKTVYTETEEGWCGYTVDVDYIKSLPPVNPQKPRTGHWRPIYQGDEIIGYRCSECEFGKTKSIYRANYCHSCGARMIESQERSDKE